MAVDVFVWLPGMSNSKVSHAAILVDGGSPAGEAYLSAWPANEGLVGVGKALTYGTAEYRTRQSDMDLEGTPLTVRLTKLDETSVKAKITELKNGGDYGFIIRNCAVQAGICLEAGIPSSLLNWSPSQYIGSIRTPAALLAYAKGLHVLYG